MGTNLSAGIMSAKAAPSDLAQRIMSRTSKGCANAAILMLADGTVFYGRACGAAVSYTHLTLPTNTCSCRSRWSPYH